jgi:hydroxymethylpyrimidine/phosphomethylpyrimidine kinase
MLDRDTQFGSIYAATAIENGVRAKQQCELPTPNLQEAKRLYGIAIQDMETAVSNIDLNRSTISNAAALIREGENYIRSWKSVVRLIS